MDPNLVGERSETSQDALRYILETWETALHDGVSPQLLAYSAMFVALSDLVATYGESAVAELTEGLVRRVRAGEFTLYRATH
jgi:hypothetical protein